jgi:ABC-type glycerol-3-phosphate transport system substrate-binding protein
VLAINWPQPVARSVTGLDYHFKHPIYWAARVVATRGAPRMRRTLALAAATSAALLAVSACTVGEPIGEQQGEGVTITFLTFETPNLTPEVWDASIQRALATNPGIRVEKLVAPTQDRTSYAQQLLTSGQFPDVMVAVSPGGFAEGGHLYAWQPDELEDFVCPDCGSIGGKVYQLPANTQAIPMVYFNETLFAQAGIAAPPTTYAELLAAAEKLKAAGVTPFVIGGEHDALGPTWAGILATEVFAKNPDWVTDRRAGTAKFTDPEFIAGATKLADLATRGYIDKGDLALDYAAAQQAFLDGKGAMYAMGNWFAAAADNPDTKPSFPVGQFFWPSDDGRLVAPGFTGGGLLVNAASPNLEAAKRFALSFQLDRQNLDASVKNDGLIPAIKGYSPPADAGPVFREGARLWQEAVAKGAVVEAFGFTVGDAGLLPGVVPDWDTAGQDLVSGSKTPAEVAAFLDGEWEKES